MNTLVPSTVACALPPSKVTQTGAPAFHIAPAAQFGAAVGAITKDVPVSLASYANVPSSSNVLPAWVTATGNNFATNEAMRDRLDERVIAERHGVGKQLTETLGFHRRGARGIGERLMGAMPFKTSTDPLTATVEVDGASGANVVAFASGFGDGSYPTYAGFDGGGTVLVVLTDFGILDAAKG